MMNIEALIKKTGRPELYEPGNAVMWTDPYISKRALEIHLNEHIDLGSRKPETIQKTIEWILSRTNKEEMQILDLGCGPGLYAKILAERGHHVTGVDFSANSIEYAKKVAAENMLDITYINEDYTQLNLPEDQFDLVMMIFTDFGPLLPEAREQLLRIVKRVLKPGGCLIFDVLNDTNVESMLSPKNWEASEQGFWSENPHLLLSESFLYEKEKIVLYQHTVIEDLSTKVYRFWTRFFSNADLEELLDRFGFGELSFHQNVIPSGDGYDSQDVTLCIASINDGLQVGEN